VTRSIKLSKQPKAVTAQDSSPAQAICVTAGVTPALTVVFAAWTCLTKKEQEQLLPSLLSSMPGWQAWKESNISFWLDTLFENVGNVL